MRTPALLKGEAPRWEALIGKARLGWLLTSRHRRLPSWHGRWAREKEGGGALACASRYAPHMHILSLYNCRYGIASSPQLNIAAANPSLPATASAPAAAPSRPGSQNGDASGTSTVRSANGWVASPPKNRNSAEADCTRSAALPSDSARELAARRS
jgi:hypothetical protein